MALGTALALGVAAERFLLALETVVGAAVVTVVTVVMGEASGDTAEDVAVELGIWVAERVSMLRKWKM